jgi:uncharacterized protein (TIGR02118 family)
MAILSVLYPRSEGSHFDHEYYVDTHIPMVQDRWSDMGFQSVQLVRGTAALDSTAPAFELIALITFTNLDDLKAALGKYGAEVMADVPNFTNIQALLQFNESV